MRNCKEKPQELRFGTDKERGFAGVVCIAGEAAGAVGDGSRECRASRRENTHVLRAMQEKPQERWVMAFAFFSSG